MSKVNNKVSPKKTTAKQPITAAPVAENHRHGAGTGVSAGIDQSISWVPTLKKKARHPNRPPYLTDYLANCTAGSHAAKQMER